MTSKSLHDIKYIRSVLKQYPNVLSKELETLDQVRRVDVPASLVERRKSGGAYLDKPQLCKLIEWKLKHGTFRPSLMNWVTSNDDYLVRDTTRKAFGLCRPVDDEEPTWSRVLPAMKELIKLKGIGPASASLILSVHDPTNVPFFSDELLMLTVFDTSKSGKKIAYSMKEYEQLFANVQKTRVAVRDKSNQDVSALDLEMFAWARERVGTEYTDQLAPAPRASEHKRKLEVEADPAEGSSRPKRSRRNNK